MNSWSFATSKQLEIRVIDEYSMPIDNAIFSILERSKNHKVIQEKKTTDGTFHLTIEYDKEYYFMIQSQAFFVSHLFLSFHEIKNQSLEGDVLNTQNTNVRIVSKNTIAIVLKRIPYFQFLAKDQNTGEYIDAEYSIRLNKTGAVAIRKARKGEPIEYLPEMFCTFEVSVRKDNYVAYTKEFLYDKSFKGLNQIFELKVDSLPIRADSIKAILVKNTTKPIIPKVIAPTPNLIIPFEQGSFYLTAETQEHGVGSAKLNSYLAYLRAVVIQIYLDNHQLQGVKTVIETITNPETDTPLAARRVAKIYIEHPQDFISRK